MQTAIRFEDDILSKKGAEFLSKYINMMFFEGDAKRPNCFEHYNPSTGQPSDYRGVDDYQHSWVVDLLIKYVVGLQHNEGKIIIRPFPFKIRHILLDNVFVDGMRFTLEKKDDFWNISINGRKYYAGKIKKNGLILENLNISPKGKKSS